MKKTAVTIALLICTIMSMVSVHNVYSEVNTDPGVTGVVPENYYTTDSVFSAYTGVKSYAHGGNIHYNSTGGLYANYSTANHWYEYQTWQVQSSFGNVSSSVSDGSLTILNGGEGKYLITVDNSIRAPFGALITQGIAKNGVVVDEFIREMTLGPARELTYFNLSSTDSYTQDVYIASDSSTYSARYTNFTSTQKALEAVSAIDGIYYHVNEANVTPGFLINGEIGGVDIPHAIRIIGAYDGSNHVVRISTKNISTGVFDYFTDNGSDWYDTGALPGVPGDYSERLFKFAAPRKNYVDSNGIVYIRIEHETNGSGTHDFEIDYMNLIDRLNSIPFPSHHEIDLVEGDKISLQFKTDLQDSDMIFDHVDITLIRIGN